MMESDVPRCLQHLSERSVAAQVWLCTLPSERLPAVAGRDLEEGRLHWPGAQLLTGHICICMRPPTSLPMPEPPSSAAVGAESQPCGQCVSVENQEI